MRSVEGIGSFERGDLERLDAALAAFLHESGAHSALLVDRAGRIVATAGEVSGFDPVIFASLAAADFAAGDQLAELLGETEFSSLYHEGDAESMFLADVGGRAILAALFDDRTTQGLVRITARATVPGLEVLFEQIAARQPAEPGPTLSADWLDEARDEIDRLFTG